MLLERLLEVGGRGVCDKASAYCNAHDERCEGKSADSQVPAALFMKCYRILESNEPYPKQKHLGMRTASNKRYSMP